MADTVSIILEYLEKQQFTRAAAELRSEIKRKQSEQQNEVRDGTLPQSASSAPPIQPDASDLDVDVYLRLAQEASAGRLGSSSSTTSQDSGASPFQLSPNSLLPDQSGGQGAFCEGSRPKITVSDAPAAHDNADGSQHSSGSRSPTARTDASGVSSSSSSAPQQQQQWERGSLPPPLPMAEPVASSVSPTSSAAPAGDSDLPQLRPIRLSHSGSTGARASKLQTLPEEEVATDLEEAVAEPGVPGEEVEKKVETGHAGGGGGRDVTGPLVIGPAVTTTAEGSSQELPGQAVGVRKPHASVAAAVSATAEASTTSAAAVVSSGGAGTGAATHSASGGGGAQDGEDAQSAISLSTDGAAVASEPPDDSAWDSDTYDDEDDVGYTRQPIEDEEWFLLHEIEYPPDGDGEVEGTSEGNKESKEVGKAEEEEVREEKAGEDHAGNAGDGDYEGASPVEDAGPQVIPEDGTFFSGEEKYTQKKRAGESGEGEDQDLDHGEPAPGSDGQGEWSGVFSSGRKRADGKGGVEGREGEEEEEDEQMFADSRSVGVMSSDMADAGSSIRESLVGSEGDADSVKGLNIGGNAVQQGATPGGRQSGARDGGEGADDEGGEEVESAERPSAGGDGGSKSVSDVYYESGSRRKKQTKKQGGEEKAETDAGGSDADREKEGDEERDENAGGDEEFGFGALGGSGGLGSGEKSARTAPGSGKGTGHPPVSPGGTSSDAGGEGLGEGGLGGGFSFPSPSSHEGGNLSRMGSGRSHFSSTDGLGSDKNFAELPVGEEEAPDVMSAADDTLAAWKRRSASSSPILSPSTAPLRAGSGGNMDLEEQHQRTEETRLTLTTSSSLGAAGARRLSEEAKEQQRAALSKQGKELKPEEAAAAVAAAAAVVAAASEKGREAVNTGDVKDTPHQGEEGKKGLVPAKAQKPSAAPGASASAAAPSGKSDGIAASGGKEVSAKKEESKGAPAPGPVAPAAAAPAAAAAAAGSAEKPKDGPGVQSSKAPVAEAAAAPEVKKAEQSSTAATGAASTSAAATGGESSESKKPSRDIDEFETFYLKIIHRKNRTGFEEEKDFPVVLNSVIAGRYYVTEYLGSAAFSKAIQAHDLHTGLDVCLKIIKNNKDFFDQSLDEVKLLKFVNRNDPADEHHILRLYDYFYHREHLFIICELLRANLYEFQKYNRDSGGEVYFTMPRLQKIARQVLDALKFMHSLGLIHCDLKPENILIKSYSRCEVKVIDLGSSCFETDHLCSYVQSRSYRAPEVILGLPYGPKIDIWSLGCILAELCSGQVLFQNDSLATLLARVVGILGPIDPQLLKRGRERHKFFTRDHMLYERNPETEQLEYLIPKRTTLRHRVPMGDPGFIEFVAYLLHVDPSKRPTAAEALKHPWLSQRYD